MKNSKLNRRKKNRNSKRKKQTRLLASVNGANSKISANHTKRENGNPSITAQTKKSTADYVHNAAVHSQNANSRTLFKNATLTCQFLKNYTNLSIFKDLKPEDIEDVTEKYQAFLGIEFESDTIKRIRIQLNGNEESIFVIPLIEHKSSVDYDVAMQLLRYMTVIWYDYRNEENAKKSGFSRLKSFRYPLIIPLVYYEGSANWTADLHLRDRISHWELAEQFVPDFTYQVVRVHDYTNDDLKIKSDEFSLALMFNRLQTVKDYTEFVETSRDFVNRIYANAPEDIKKIFQDILWSLQIKMNVPTDEAQKMVEEMEADGMGYLFENMEKIDIQAERRNTMLARKDAEIARLEAEIAKLEKEQASHDAEQAKRDAEQAKRDAEIAKRETEQNKAVLTAIFAPLIAQCKAEQLTREETISRLLELYPMISRNALERLLDTN